MELLPHFDIGGWLDYWLKLQRLDNRCGSFTVYSLRQVLRRSEVLGNLGERKVGSWQRAFPAFDDDKILIAADGWDDVWVHRSEFQNLMYQTI